MPRRRFTSPIAMVSSAPRVMDSFGNFHKRADGYYCMWNDGAGGTKWAKAATNDFRLTDIGVAYTVRPLFVGSVCHTMIAIALAESGGDAVVVGGPNGDGTYDYGLFQINSSHYMQFAWWLPQENAKAAFKLYDEAFRRLKDRDAALKEQWATYRSKKVNLYAPRATAALAWFGGPLDNGEVIEQPILGTIEEGVAGAIDDIGGDLFAGVQKMALIATGAMLTVLGVIMIAKKGM